MDFAVKNFWLLVMHTLIHLIEFKSIILNDDFKTSYYNPLQIALERTGTSVELYCIILSHVVSFVKLSALMQVVNFLEIECV